MNADLLFYLFAALTCGGALGVVITQNIVRMAFWLILSLGSVSALFFLLGADFIGAAQLLIYVGGTVVLLVFGVMLTASGPYLQIKTSAADGLLGACVGGLLLFVLISTVCGLEWSELPGHQNSIGAVAEGIEGSTLRPLGLAFLGLRPDRATPGDETSGKLATGYLLPFEIISVHLLVVLIGAAYLARAKRRTVSDDHGLS
ncbi:MAG TPA: NADH-quinone oxidoreductase subunit J [Planctomycetaceae bacterium]|nr:NADH-quinone oxidoreductase subunit J [Planctomycetaceae bacterium]